MLIEREERRLNSPEPSGSGHPNISSLPASSSSQLGIPPSQPGASTSTPEPPPGRPNAQRPSFPINRAGASTSGPRHQTAASSSRDSASRPSASTSQSSPPFLKRRRLSTGFECSEHHDSKEHETRGECSGSVTIKDHDVKSGKYIVLENLSEHDQSLGGWKVIQRSGNHKVLIDVH